MVYATSLTAKCFVLFQKSAGPNAKRKQLTEVSIFAGPYLVARRIIPGNWYAKDAIQEYKRFPARFTTIRDDVKLLAA